MYEAFVAAVANSHVNSLKAILWYQGERDVFNDVSQAAYQTAESLMLDNMQADTGLATVKMISALIGTVTAEEAAAINAIRAAKINRWINDADIEPGPTGIQLAGTHWESNAEATLLAQRWWRTIDAALYGGTEAARGPQFSSASRVGAVVTVTFTGGQGNLANQTDATGWKVTDNGVAATISSTAANGTNAVDITLSGVPAGTVLVSFGNGNEAIGATLCDSGTYPLPPEPFIDQGVT